MRTGTVFLSLLLSGVMSGYGLSPDGIQRTVDTERFLNLHTIALWQGSAPGAKGNTPDDVPSITVFAPELGYANGTAVIVAPGGAYHFIAASSEGRYAADWLAARGVTAFVLHYRLRERYPFPTALADAQRAVRFIRANAKRWGVLPDKIGMMGFSAGGHLTAMAGTSFEGANLPAADPVDRLSDRPDFLIMAYPVLLWMEPNNKGSSAYCTAVFADQHCDPLLYTQFIPEKLVRADTPPTFLYHTGEDDPDGSIRFYRALLAKSVSAELHIFAQGPHGTALGNGDASLDNWPILLEHWMRQRDLLTPPAQPLLPAANDDGPLSLECSLARVMGVPAVYHLIESFLGRNESKKLLSQFASVPVGVLLQWRVTDEQMDQLDRTLRKARSR